MKKAKLKKRLKKITLKNIEQMIAYDNLRIVALKTIMRKNDRISDLQELCNDLYLCSHQSKCCNCPAYQGEDYDCAKTFLSRMQALGLLEE